MRKKHIFRGVGTAIITPFHDGRIDYPMLRKIIENQIQNGVDALIVGGTTGEASALSTYEKHRLFHFATEFAGGRVPIILGSGTNDTKASLALTRAAKAAGADGALIVTPYYNRGTEEGLYRHYMTIADGADIPIILYNVPGRTTVNLSMPLLRRLMRHERICGIKEASDSADRLVALSTLSEELPLYSGNDSQFYLNLALGGVGVISVISNAFPDKVKKIYESFEAAKYKDALLMQSKLLPFIKLCFEETNPSPIKYAMSLLGYGSCDLRLPLYEPSDALKERIKAEAERLREYE